MTVSQIKVMEIEAIELGEYTPISIVETLIPGPNKKIKTIHIGYFQCPQCKRYMKADLSQKERSNINRMVRYNLMNADTRLALCCSHACSYQIKRMNNLKQYRFDIIYMIKNAHTLDGTTNYEMEKKAKENIRTVKDKMLDVRIINEVMKKFKPANRKKKWLNIKGNGQIIVEGRKRDGFSWRWEDQGHITIATLNEYSQIFIETDKGIIKITIMNSELIKWLLGLTGQENDAIGNQS